MAFTFQAIVGGILVRVRSQQLESPSIQEFLIDAAVTLASLWTLSRIVTTVAAGVGRWGSVVPVAAWVVVGGLWSYHQQVGAAFNYAVVAESHGSLLTPEALMAIGARVCQLDAAIVFILGAGVCLAEWRWGCLARFGPARASWFHLLYWIPLYGMFVLMPWSHGDETAMFLRSIVSYQRMSGRHLHDMVQTPYPWVKSDAPAGGRDARAGDPRHVFVIMMESVNARFLEKAGPGGRPYTPFINRLIPTGLFCERFYGNSTFTVRGQECTLASLYPGFKGTLADYYADSCVQGLPQLLAKRGFRTAFFQGGKDLMFANTALLTEKLGFQVSKGMNAEFLEKEDAPYVWGWGLQDDRFYEKVFGYLDQDCGRQQAQGHSNSPPRYFVVLATVGNHFPFDNAPARLPKLISNPRTTTERYANSLSLSDNWLKAFFDLLAARPAFRDSLVIVMGDHGFPVNDRKVAAQEVGCSDDSFRTLFLALGPGISGRRIPVACSQVDVAPTILDLLQIGAANHFVGRSIMRRNEREELQLLIQPYDGRYLISILYPFKYVYHASTGEESLYDLRLDPAEKRNEIHHGQVPQLRQLRAGIETLYLNDLLLQENRIWPCP